MAIAQTHKKAGSATNVPAENHNPKQGGDAFTNYVVKTLVYLLGAIVIGTGMIYFYLDLIGS